MKQIMINTALVLALVTGVAVGGSQAAYADCGGGSMTVTCTETTTKDKDSTGKTTTTKTTTCTRKCH